MKRTALLVACLAAACQTASTTSMKMTIAPDVAQRSSKLPPTEIAFDTSLLTENERQVIAKLIEASKLIDEIFWRQVSEDNPALRERLSKEASPAYEYFVKNRGPWDRLKDDQPFIGTKKKPAGAAFYPEDMTREEFEKYVAAHPEKKDALQGLFTVVRRQGDALVAIPYSTAYREFLEPAAARLREAAALTTNASLRRFLTTRADALLTDNYRDSDMAWMDLNGRIEVVIGPYEVYEDNLFNYKAAFESFVTVVDPAESAKLAAYAHALPDMERNLPEPEQYKNPNRGTESPISVVQEIYTAGDARRGVQTAAFNLPNDEFVREKKGSKKVLLKNVMDAKFVRNGRPIAVRLLEPQLITALSFDAFFNHVLFHELSHALGPAYVTMANGERVEVRIPLKNLYSTIEECKADVLGIWNLLYALDKRLVKGFDDRLLLATYAGLMFRSTRFGVGEAHGRGTAVQWNWLREKGAIIPAGKRYDVDFQKMKDGVRDLATELLTIEATGDYNRANALLEKYGNETDEMRAVNLILQDIPVDIWPVFPAAGEK